MARNNKPVGRLLTRTWVVLLVAWSILLSVRNHDRTSISSVHLSLSEDSIHAQLRMEGGLDFGASWKAAEDWSLLPNGDSSLCSLAFTTAKDDYVVRTTGMTWMPLGVLLPDDGILAESDEVAVRVDPMGREDTLLVGPSVPHARPWGRAGVHHVPLKEFENTLLLTGRVRAVECGLLSVNYVSERGHAAQGASDLVRILSSLQDFFSGSRWADVVVIERPRETRRLPTRPWGDTLVLEWTPGNAMSAIRLVREIIEHSASAFDTGRGSWEIPSLATVLAVHVLGESGLYSTEELWDRVFARYVFLFPSRERPLADHDPEDEKDMEYLRHQKGPLLLHALRSCALAEAASGDLLDVYRSAIDPLSSKPLESLLRPLLREEGQDLLERSIHSVGFLGKAAPHSRDLGLVPRAEIPPDQGWDIVLSLTSGTEGFLEACGCRALQGGGLARRVSRIREEEKTYGPILGLDLGNMVPRIGRRVMDSVTLDELRVHLRNAIRVGYRGFAIGANEIYLGPKVMDMMEQEAGPGFAPPLTGTEGRLTLVAGLRRLVWKGIEISLIAVPQVYPRWIDPEEYEQAADWVDVPPPLEVLSRASGSAPELMKPSGRLVVLYGTIAPWHVREIVDAFPGIDLVLSGDAFLPPARDGADEPSGIRSGGVFRVGTATAVVSNMGEYGVAFLRLRVEGGLVTAAAIEGVRLLSTMPKDEETALDLDSLYSRSRDPNPSLPTPLSGLDAEQGVVGGSNGYVGAKSCQRCHPGEYRDWMASPHAGAYKTLVRAHREHVPECLRCHTTGIGIPTGYSVQGGKARSLVGVQCETCHGPGEAHTIAGHGKLPRIRSRLEIPGCVLCHDAEHSEPLRGREEEIWRIAGHLAAREARR